MTTKSMIRNCKVKKQCDKTWAVLSESSPHGILKNLRMDSVRYCERCDDFVWWCSTEKELVDALTSNQCVAFVVGYGAISDQTDSLLLEKLHFIDSGQTH